MADKNKQGDFYTRPVKMGKWEGFKTFLWNSETSQFLGRTGSSWAKILLFYVIFYAALAGFFAAMLLVFYQTLDDNKPKWQQDEGLIGSNPGLGFRPMPPESNVESTLIWFKSSDSNNIKYWTDEIDKFLETYKSPENMDETERKKLENRVDCGYDKTTDNPPPGKVCKVDISSFGSCTSGRKYNYGEAKPCIFLKLNKIFNWQPILYNTTGENDLPVKMPKDLKDAIRTTKQASKLNTVWISCEGENPADIENIGPIQYFPNRGFPGYFFPFQNQLGYMPPIVALHFERPKPGVLINIECKAWAKNIIHDRTERRGSVHFELMVDN